jgi:hypothetical protein
VHEAERRVPRPELLHALEEADYPAILCIRRHPVPEFRLEDGCTVLDDLMEPLADDAIRFRHCSDRREHGGFAVFRDRERIGLLLEGSCRVGIKYPGHAGYYQRMKIRLKRRLHSSARSRVISPISPSMRSFDTVAILSNFITEETFSPVEKKEG